MSTGKRLNRPNKKQVTIQADPEVIPEADSPSECTPDEELGNEVIYEANSPGEYISDEELGNEKVRDAQPFRHTTPVGQVGIPKTQLQSTPHSTGTAGASPQELNGT